MYDISEFEEKQKSSELIFDGKVLHLYRDDIYLPDGSEGFREYCKHVGAVCVVPVTDEGEVICVRQYRYAIGQELLEIPAGKIDPGETPEQCAARELVEETGYRAGKLTELGVVYPIAAYSSETQYLFYAENLTPDKQHLDEDEFLSVEHVDFATAFDMVMNGEITDSKTQIGILKINNIRQELV